MRRIILIIGLLLSCVAVAQSTEKQEKNEADLTQFDNPFLLGDWYLLNPNPENSQENFRAIKLTLSSNYEFQIDIQKRDYSIEHWVGFYAASDDQIILGLHSKSPQVYEYDGNHNRLRLNGVVFTKSLPNAIAGIWSSELLSGSNLLASSVSKLDLILQPDFVFLFRASSDKGSESVHRGVYYLEGDQLVLLYEDGEQDTRYVLDQDKLTLKGEDMYAELARVR